MIDIFKVLQDYDRYFENQLALSGTILGLIVATSTFILQSGFISFQYSRSMFVKYYVHQSKFIFLALSYNIIFSVFILYTNMNATFLFIAHNAFALIFTKYFLDFYSHKGYIITLHSTKYNPYKSGPLRYVRYLINLGLLPNAIILGTIYIIFFYPLHFNAPFRLSNHQIYMATVNCLVFSVLVVIRVIPQFFDFSEQEYKSKSKNEVVDNTEVDLTKENEILKDLLQKNGRFELNHSVSTPLFDNLLVQMPVNKSEAFFVIYVELSNKTVYEIVDALEKYSYDFFIELSNTHVDVNSFVLSYFIKIDSEPKTRTYFIRARRNEIEEIKKKHFEPKEFLVKLPNKLIDELFRGI